MHSDKLWRFFGGLSSPMRTGLVTENHETYWSGVRNIDSYLIIGSITVTLLNNAKLTRRL